MRTTNNATTTKRLIVATTVAIALTTAACQPAPTPWTGNPSPFGAVDTATLTKPNTATITGWADEQDTPDPVEIVAITSVDETPTIAGTTTANAPRPDVTATYPQSTNPGFTLTISGPHITAGTIVCVTAINRNAGTNSLLGCTAVNAAPTTTAPTTPATPTTAAPTTVPEAPTDPKPIAIAIGPSAHHTLAVLDDGTIKAWGNNNEGQLGDGTNNWSNTPVNVTGIATAKSVAAGNLHSVALMADGTIKTWGLNASGQLGNGTNADSNTPVDVAGITTAVSIAAGYRHSVALMADGTIQTWGNNDHGQLGDSTTDASREPVTVSGIDGSSDATTAKSIAAGNSHSVALMNDGTVQTWGNNASGQLGIGTSPNSNTPVNITSITNAASIAAASLHSVALMNDGTIQTWGNNASGQLGDGTFANSNVPVTVTGFGLA